MQLPYSDELNIGYLSRLFDNTSNFNAPVTIDNYYAAEANSDLALGGYDDN